MLANGQAPQGDRQRNRKQTADGPLDAAMHSPGSGKGATEV